jgi:hypothetical protein
MVRLKSNLCVDKFSGLLSDSQFLVNFGDKEELPRLAIGF